MSVTQVQNSKANVKKSSVNDIPYAPAQPVASSYNAVSTAGQSTIANLGFSVDTTAPQNFQLFVDGKLLTLGSTSDYTFSAIAADGTSSSIALNQTLPVGLNITALKLGLKKESEFLTDNRFTQLYEAQSMGFQSFVNTNNVLNASSSAGTPAAGTFYSSIPFRAPIVDMSQDLKPRMGIERIPVQQLALLQSEFGPNGEPVWAAANDIYGQIRFVGSSWVNQITSNGVFVQDASNGTATTGDFIEVTFYGTGLNMLTIINGSAYAATYSVDGGTASSVTAYPSTGLTNVLSGRNYGPSQIISIVSGLTLGIHTVKITNTGSTYGLGVYGFEILNISANVITNPGVAYNSGKKIQLASQSSIAYSSIVTGIRGGRVLQYLTATGSVAQAFTAVNSAAAYLTAADHTNEEVARTYFPREFGAGRTDDFSRMNTSNQAAAFTLDDGTTSLLTTNGNFVNFNNIDALQWGAVGAYHVFTFVGTGLDVQMSSLTLSGGTFTAIIDGTSVGNFTVPATGNYQYKVASGLPYGTHTFKLLYAATTSGNLGVSRFTVYQPKKPTLPAGAVELADYNVMANYVGATNSTSNVPSTGILAKTSARECVYTGTWNITNRSNNVGLTAGQDAETATVGSTVSYTFFGTGIEFGMYYINNPCAVTVAIDGSAYTGAATPSSSTYINWAPGTSTATVLGGADGCLQITGLALGLHTIKLTVLSIGSSATLSFLGFQVITPIHSNKSNTYLDVQNTLSVGSNGISDNRKTSAIKDLPATKKNWVLAQGISLSPSSSATSWVPVPDMSATVKTSGGDLRIDYTINASMSAASVNSFAIFVDGVFVQQKYQSINGTTPVYKDTTRISVSPGVHKVDIYWSVSSGYTITATANYRTLLVEEVY